MAFLTLRLGSTGTAVRALERKLVNQGYLDQPADTRFDKATARAVLAYKRDHGWDDPKPVVAERLASALNLTDQFDSGSATPKTMKGGTYNAEIGRDPKHVANVVRGFLENQNLDFLQLQEISGYHRELERIPGYKLITFPGSKDRGETGVLVRDSIEAKFPRSHQADSGWTNVRGGKAQPRAATSVRIAGWLRVASVHAPPGIDWVNGRPVGAPARVKSYQSLMQKLLKQANRNDTALLIGGDWNEGARTGGPGSPSWLAAQAGLTKHANHSIDWEMSRGLRLQYLKPGPDGGSDHRLRTFTVTQR